MSRCSTMWLLRKCGNRTSALAATGLAAIRRTTAEVRSKLVMDMIKYRISQTVQGWGSGEGGERIQHPAHRDQHACQRDGHTSSPGIGGRTEDAPGQVPRRDHIAVARSPAARSKARASGKPLRSSPPRRPDGLWHGHSCLCQVPPASVPVCALDQGHSWGWLTSPAFTGFLSM
jgi:hypothetical protein